MLNVCDLRSNCIWNTSGKLESDEKKQKIKFFRNMYINCKFRIKLNIVNIATFA